MPRNCCTCRHAKKRRVFGSKPQFLTPCVVARTVCNLVFMSQWLHGAATGRLRGIKLEDKPPRVRIAFSLKRFGEISHLSTTVLSLGYRMTAVNQKFAISEFFRFCAMESVVYRLLRSKYVVRTRIKKNKNGDWGYCSQEGTTRRHQVLQ